MAFACAVTGPTSSLWSTDVLRVSAYKDSSGVEHLFEDMVCRGPRVAMTQRHSLAKLCLAKAHGAAPSLMVQGAVFEMPSQCGYTWVSVSDLWDELNLKMSPYSGAAWFQIRKQRWEALASDLALGANAVRLSVPYQASVEGGSRVLCFASIHLSLLLVISTRSAFCHEKRCGRLDSEEARASFARVAQGLLSYLPKDFDIALRIDEDAQPWQSQPVGRRPCKALVRDGALDLGSLIAMRTTSLLDVSPGMRKQCERVMALHGHDFKSAFVTLCKMCSAARTGLLLAIFKQCLWQVVYLVEKTLTSLARTRDIGTLMRQPSRTYSDVDASTVSETPCWDAKNHRHVERELCRHLQASQRALAKETCLSLCGPDGTKVGTDLSINLAALMGGDSGLVALAFPQAPRSS